VVIVVVAVVMVVMVVEYSFFSAPYSGARLSIGELKGVLRQQ